jgi:RNA polymerase sigma-70 factor (ECF subfamily)
MEEPARPRRRRFSDDETDLKLLARVREGDRAAFRELHSRYYGAVLRFAYRITRRLDLAEEAVNDVMLVVWRDARAFAGRSSVATWIMGIAYRKAMKSVVTSRRWSIRKAAVDFGEWLEHSGPHVEPTEHEDLRDLLDAALDRLSPDHRAVVELTYFHGCSYEEIAAIVDCPVNTVKTRMFHARAKLRKLLPTLGEGRRR